MSGIHAKQMMIEDTQQLLVVPFFSEAVAPTLTRSPTVSTDTEPPTSSASPTSM